MNISSAAVRHGPFVPAMFELYSTLYRFLGTSLNLCMACDGAGADCALVDQEYCSGVHDVILYSVRYITFYTAFAGLNVFGILRSQTWFNSNVAHVIGVTES